MIGYQAATVAPAYRQPEAAAVLPSMSTESLVASMGESRMGSGQSKCSRANSNPRSNASKLASRSARFLSPKRSSRRLRTTSRSTCSRAESAPT